MLEYKAEMDLNAKDFNAGKVKFYENVRQRLAPIYKEDVSFFGIEKTVSYPVPERDYSLLSVEEQVMKKKWEKQKKLDQELIKRGYNRVLEEFKDIRQTFTSAVTAGGQRSGSGKIVMGFYKELVKLWDGSPATKSLTFCVSSNSISNNIPNTSSSNTSLVNSGASSTSCALKLSSSPAIENEVQHDSSNGYISTNSGAEDGEFLADNLSELPDPLLTLTVKKRKVQEKLPRNK